MYEVERFKELMVSRLSFLFKSIFKAINTTTSTLITRAFSQGRKYADSSPGGYRSLHYLIYTKEF